MKSVVYSRSFKWKDRRDQILLIFTNVPKLPNQGEAHDLPNEAYSTDAAGQIIVHCKLKHNTVNTFKQAICV